MLVFFFSSRRRHTRLQGDWSSDVCSSDLVDSSTNAGGVTWYWGYEHSQSAQGTNLVLNSYSTPANATSKNREDDPQHGLELTYSRELLRGKWWHFGAEGGLGYSPISVIDRQT